jgi:hypothetical protein
MRTLATIVDRWWNEIAAFIDTGHSNAKSEGVNRVIKLVARAAFGFRNATNQRLRTRCVTTRRARGHLRTARRPGLTQRVGPPPRLHTTSLRPIEKAITPRAIARSSLDDDDVKPLRAVAPSTLVGF